MYRHRISNMRATVLLTLSGVALASIALAAGAAPPAVSVSNLQPVSAQALIDEDYVPGDADVLVYSEPTAYPGLPGSGYRATIDVQLQNDEADYIRLDEYQANIGAWGETLANDDLLSMPETLLSFPLANAELRRPALVDGGFGVSGLKIEQHLIDDPDSLLTYGEALDLVPYQLDQGEGYLVVGSYQFLIGDVPDSVDDLPPSVGTQGFVAKYSSTGALSRRLTTAHDEVSAIADLGHGDYLLAGRYELANDETSLMITRVHAWETNDEGESVDLDYVTPVSDYGADEEAGATFVSFYDGGQPCAVRRAVGATVLAGGSYVAVAAELDCAAGDRIGVAMLLADGTLLQSFGSGGAKVFVGPGNMEAVPVGIEGPKSTLRSFTLISTKNRWVWLGAAVGAGCTPLASDCSFALTRFDYLSGALHAAGWITPAEESYMDGARPRDMALDKQGRPVMAGETVNLGGDRMIAVHRFKTDGTSDATFGGQGWSLQMLLGHESAAYAVRPRSNGEIALAVLTYEDTPDGIDNSMAMMTLSANGTVVWQHDPYSEGDSFTLVSVRTKLNYGYRYQTEVTSHPWALVEDQAKRLVMVGFAGSDYLKNPCKKMADELGEPLLDYGVACGGPWSIALARYLPFGAPDSRRWLAPNEKRTLVVPSDVDLGFAPPSQMQLNFQFDGFSNLSVARAMEPFHNAVVDVATGSVGAYPFPFNNSVLNFNERFSVSAHPLDHHHRNAAGNRFAYDIGIVRWSNGQWVGTTGGVFAPNNEGQLIFGRPVRAVVDGKVVACRRSAPDNPLGVIENGDANFVTIKHTVNPFDRSRTEFISYLHFQQDSVPLEVCPNICPAEQPDCDLETEGVDPNGAELPVPVDVIADQLIGLVGNSGNSTSPHLHVHITTDANADGGPTAGSYPLLFHSVLLQNRSEGPKGLTWPVNGQAIQHGSLAMPTD